ncbi:MAG: TetR/AcrR family transcriptional regulator [bacterium]|nr:TetR/AcrR family transcriptional regulator [bacterium]
MQQPSSDKRRARGVETRRLILRSAVSSIASLGLSNMTLDSVAKRVGVSRALVVFHFKSKRLLVKEALEFLGRRYSEGWNSVVAMSDGTTMERIFQLVDYDIRFACENPEYLSAWHAFWGESKGNALYHELGVPRDQRYAGEMKELLATMINEGGYDKQELPAIITGINAMLFGLWLESHLDPKPDDYIKGMAAVRLFLSKTFPNQPLPTTAVHE